jgi:predicted DNA-binding antitoxin AbrB/MazE fold protein
LNKLKNQNITHNQVYKDNDDQTARRLNDRTRNQKLYQSVPFKDGEKVEILEKKRKNDKGKQKCRKEIYTMDKKEVYKLLFN